MTLTEHYTVIISDLNSANAKCTALALCAIAYRCILTANVHSNKFVEDNRQVKFIIYVNFSC